MSGSALFALALVRNELIRLWFQVENPGPAIGVTVSRDRIRWYVRTQPSFQAPAAEVFHVQSGSFQISQAWMLLTVVAASRALTIVSTLDSQSAQLTHLYGKSG